MVTIGSGPKVFSAGFDLGFWKKAPENKSNCLKMLHVLNAKLLTTNVNSLCVINGHAVAGGLLTAINHDRLIMTSNPSFKVSLPEIKLGIPIPHALIQNVKHVTSGAVTKTLLTGQKLDEKEAKDLGIVSDLYEDQDQL